MKTVNGCSFFLRAKRGELEGAKKEERLWLSLVSRGFAARSSRVLALQIVSKEKESNIDDAFSGDCDLNRIKIKTRR